MTARLRLHFVIKHIASYCAFFRVFSVCSVLAFIFGFQLWCSVYSVQFTAFTQHALNVERSLTGIRVETSNQKHKIGVQRLKRSCVFRRL